MSETKQQRPAPTERTAKRYKLIRAIGVVIGIIGAVWYFGMSSDASGTMQGAAGGTMGFGVGLYAIGRCQAGGLTADPRPGPPASPRSG